MLFSIQDRVGCTSDTVEIEDQSVLDLNKAGQFHELMWAN